MTGTPTWEQRRLGQLTLRYRPDSHAAREIDEWAEWYGDALAEVVNALELDETALPPITVYLAEQPPSHDASAGENGQADLAELTIWVEHSAETPAIAPELKLTHALLAHLAGPPQADACFWDEGLAGHLAARSGNSPFHAEAAARCRELLADALLPPLAELVAESNGRVSALASTAAAAFAEYVIERFGLERYRRLLCESRAGGPGLFDEVYGCPLAVVDRDWRRGLEGPSGSVAGSTISTLRRLLPLARPYWRSGLMVLAYTLVGIAFSLALPLSFRFLVDNILGQRPLDQAVPFVGPSGYMIMTGQQQIETLTKLLVLLGLLYVLAAIARLRLGRLLNEVGESFVFDVRRRVLEVLGRLPAAYFARTTTADVTQRVVGDAAMIQTIMTGAIVPMFSAGLSIVLYTFLLFSLQARLALVAMLGLPVLAVVYQLRRRSRRAAARERVRRISDLNARVNEFTDAHVPVKTYGAATFLLSRLDRRMDIHRLLNVAFAQENTRLAQVGMLVMNLTQVAVLLTGGYLVIASGGQDLAPGGLVAFYILLNQLFAPVQQLSRASQSVAGASANVDRVAELLAQPTERDAPDGIELGPLREGIRFEKVSFAYARQRAVLKQVSLEIPAGATVAFVGPTGAGKSSIVHLLPRLYDPQRGTITWNGVDLRAARLESLRQQVVLVPQEPVLLSATLADNIRFGLAEATDEQVHRAAALAEADGFITALPDGYDTVLGDQGGGLSGGQRQRIALARALLREPSVLILDEATSALDSTTQREIQDALRQAGRGRTVIKIAHRLETIADADVIFVLDDGRLVEQGKHAELLAVGGVYARLFEDQMGMLRAAGGSTSPRQAARWLARLAPFSELPADALADLGAALTPMEQRMGATIYRRGDESNELYVLARGQVAVFMPDRAGNERQVKTLGTGATFGDVGFLRGVPHPTTVRAATDVLLFALQRPAFAALFDREAPEANGRPGTQVRSAAGRPAGSTGSG